MTLRRSTKTFKMPFFSFFFWRRKQVDLHLVPWLPVWELFQEQKKHLILLKRSVLKKTKQKTKSDVPQSAFSETPLTPDAYTSRYSVCVVVCVFRDTFTFLEGGFEGSYQNLLSFISSGLGALCSSAGGFPSSPFTLAYSCPHPSSPLPREKHKHMLHRCPQIVFQ